MRLPKPTWGRSLAVIVVSMLIIAVSFVLWSNSTNPLMPEAEQALQDSPQVDVTMGDYISFRPLDATPTVGYIFYPGGRVEAGAYAPMASEVAQQGYFTAIVYAPLNLAFFGVNAADAVIADHSEITEWVVGGHSLGGVAASLYAEQHPDIDGLIFEASYPSNGNLRDRADLQVLSLYATNDGLARPEQVLASASNLPQNAQFVAIEGGNHGQFGYYGLQDGDGTATITHDEQTKQTADAVSTFLANLRPGD